MTSDTSNTQDVENESGESETDTPDVAFDDLIAKIVAEDESEKTSSFLAENSAILEESSEDTTETETTPETVAEPEVKDASLERLVSKEKEIRELIAKFDEDKKSFESEKQKVQSSSLNLDKLKEEMSLYPEKVLEKLGLDSDFVMKTLLYSKLPDSNPAKGKLREELRELETNRRFSELESKLTAKENTLRQQEQFTTITNGADEYVTKLKGDAEQAKNYPTVSKVLTKDSKKVHALVMDEIVNDARERLIRGETGDPLGYSEAVMRLEKKLSDLLPLLVGENVSGEKSTPKPEVKKPSVSNIKPATPSGKPKTKTIEDLEEEALLRGIAEFHKHNSRGTR